MPKKVFESFFKDNTPASLGLILVGTIIWSLTMFKSGLVYPFGIGFWGPNGHDGVWHIALEESLARGSWGMPVFAGETLKNYHVGFDFLMSLIVRLTRTDLVRLYFQIIPPILAILIGFLTYKFVLLWTNSKNAGTWALFFTYFGGSFGWLVTLFRDADIGGESMFWAQQSISTLINPPFALSLVFVLTGLIFLIKFFENHATYYLLLVTVFFGVLIQIKAHASVLVIIALFTVFLWRIFKNKSISLHSNRELQVFLGVVFFSLALFMPFIKASSKLLIFQPFWFLETMMGLTDRLGWPRFYSAMTTYRLGNIWHKAGAAYLVAFVIFIVGNMGTRVVGLRLMIGDWWRNFKKISYIGIFISSVIIFGILTPMVFSQAGTPWNTIQFFYYSLFFLGILAGAVVGKRLENVDTRSLGSSVVAVAIVLLTTPTTIGTLKHYLPSRPPAMISKEELEALKFLSAQPEGVVLTYPFDQIKAKAAEKNPPRPLYLYESTAYVSAFAKKPVFLEDEVNLDITGYNWRERRKKVEGFLNTLDQEEARSFLRTNNIKYIYWIKGQRARLGETQLGIDKIFENEEVDIHIVKG